MFSFIDFAPLLLLFLNADTERHHLLLAPRLPVKKSRLLREELVQAFVSSQGCDGGGGVALPVGQSQHIPGSGLLQQEARHPEETSTR